MKTYTIPSLILKEQFPDHNKYKNELLKLIDQDGVTQRTQETMFKTDWGRKADWERPWFKLIKDSLTKSLGKFVQHMGYKSFVAHNIWYQQYVVGDSHNWHIHGGNYTGVYYLELGESAPTTEILYPDNPNKCFTVEVKEGDLIFFPCHLIHRSAISNSKHRKSIISWNCSFEFIQDHYLGERENIEIL